MTTSSQLYSENYYALIVSILKGATSEQAFITMREGPSAKKRGFSDNEICEMIGLRKGGKTLKHIGSLFNINASLVCTTIRRYNQRLEKKKASGGSH